MVRWLDAHIRQAEAQVNVTTQAVDVSRYAYRVTWSVEDDEFVRRAPSFPRFRGSQTRRRQRCRVWSIWSLKRWVTSPTMASLFQSPCQHEPTRVSSTSASARASTVGLPCRRLKSVLASTSTSFDDCPKLPDHERGSRAGPAHHPGEKTTTQGVIRSAGEDHQAPRVERRHGRAAAGCRSIPTLHQVALTGGVHFVWLPTRPREGYEKCTNFTPRPVRAGRVGPDGAGGARAHGAPHHQDH